MLNTHFLNLLLKIMKTNIVFISASSRVTSNATTTNLVASMNANAYQSRILCATGLAMMLRYATILSPPSVRMRDEHIVVTIVNLLNTTGSTARGGLSGTSGGADKISVQFKRRLVAALGETVFYISAQESSDGR